jgi:hypothetical protein
VAGYSALGDASSTLLALVNRALTPFGTPPPAAELNDLTEAISMIPPRITIFLYEITEDSAVRNVPMLRENVGGVEVLRKPPLPLVLKYLITVWNPNPVTHHTILGRIAQALADHAIVSGDDLVGSLKDNNEALRLRLLSPEIEDRSRVWHAIQKPYRLSLYCEARVVRVQSDELRGGTLVNSARVDERRPEARP